MHKTTIRDIASRLGWNMGTLYLYISQEEYLRQQSDFLVSRLLVA